MNAPAVSAMKILAIEFSSEIRSVALTEADRVLGHASGTGGRTVRAVALVEAALREARLDREAVECIAVGTGPGSYAGIRAAIALAQGWQLARELRVLGIAIAECLAAQAHAEGERGEVHFLIDAQRGEFYCGRADLGVERRIQPLQIISLEQARALPGERLFVEPVLLKLFPGARAMSPDAGTTGRLAAARSDFVTADKLEPVHLRATSFVKAPPPRVIPLPE